MRGRKNPTANETPPNLPPCKVCGEQGTGFHYGVTACGACKGFFRRSLVRKESYLCIGSGNCIIGPETKRRKSCPKCRHDKCIAVGMSKEAIKTGRYSYVKKSHDIIEMIEHHFQYYVKRKQFGDGKMAEDNLEPDFEIPRKKTRTSCALEKVSVIYRQPGREFMELSPSKPAEGCRNSFHFDNINFDNGANLEINNFSEMTIPEDVRLAMSEDISTSNDLVIACGNEQHSVDIVNNSYMNSSMDFKQSEVVHYFDSQSSQPQQSGPILSPLSLASPMSEVSNSKESLASISPHWLEFPVFSDSSYPDIPLEERNSYFSYPDKEYEGGFESTYGKLHRSDDKNDIEYTRVYNTTLSATGFEHHNQNEMVHNFPQPTLNINSASENSANSPKYSSLSQQTTYSQPSRMPVLHTPVSNELERLRRLSWNDINFDDHFLSPDYDYLQDSAKTPLNKASLPSKGNKTYYHDNSNNFSQFDYENSKELLSQDVSSNYYWDMDNTSLRIQNGNSEPSKADSIDQFSFNECTNINKSFIYSDSLSMCANYYRDRHGSDSSTTSSTADDSFHSPVLIPTQHSTYDSDTCPSDSATSVMTQRLASEGIYPLPVDIQSMTSVVSTVNSSSFSSPFFSKEDDDEVLNVTKSLILLDPTTASQKFSQPLNFLNIPLQADSQTEFLGIENVLTISAIPSSTETETDASFSPETGDIFSKMTGFKTELSHDNEFLEKWTPFSLGDEAPRFMEHEAECGKNVRLQVNEDDYKNKLLPFCEYTEAELDEVVHQLKTSYQKHVVQDTNLLSDQEIAEKLQVFLDMVQLREQTFGKCAPIDREDYFSILEATGIDLGGRREWVESTAKIFNRTLQKTIRFFRSVPGFKDICHEDKTILAKSCMYEYIILSCYRGVNVEQQVILDAEHKLAFSMDFVRIVFPEMEEHVLDIFEFSRKLMDLRLSFEETLILKAISILSPDRDKLKEFDKVDRMYWRLHCCLLLSLCRRLGSPWQFYARVISALTDLRQLAFNGRQLMCNFRPDMLKLTKDIQVPLYLELMFTRADSIPDAELR